MFNEAVLLQFLKTVLSELSLIFFLSFDRVLD